MAITLDLTSITYPFITTLILGKERLCPMLKKPFAELARVQHAKMLPYVFAVLTENKKSAFTLCDGVEWFDKHVFLKVDFSNPETNKGCVKADFIAYLILHDGQKRCRRLNSMQPKDKISDFLHCYLMATSRKELRIVWEGKLLTNHSKELAEVELFQFAEDILKNVPGHDGAIKALTGYFLSGKNDIEKLAFAKRVFGLANHIHDEQLYLAIAKEVVLDGEITRDKSAFCSSVLRKCLIHFPKSCEAHTKLGLALLVQEDSKLYKEAEAHLFEALLIDPDNESCHYGLAKMYLESKAKAYHSLAKAKEHLDAIIMLPDISEYSFLLASKLYLEKEYFSISMSHWLLQEALHAAPDNKEIQNALAEFSVAFLSV